MANFLALATIFCTIGLMTWEFTFPTIDKVRNPYSALQTDMEHRISLLFINPLTMDPIPLYWITQFTSEFITPNIIGKKLDDVTKTSSNPFNYFKGPLQEFLTDSNGGNLPHTVLAMSKCFLTLIRNQTPSRPMNIQRFQNMNLFLSSGTQLTNKKADMTSSGETCTINGQSGHPTPRNELESKNDITFNDNLGIEQLEMNSTQEMIVPLITNSRNQWGKNNAAHSSNTNVTNIHKTNTTYCMVHWIPPKLAGNIMQTSNMYTLRRWGKETLTGTHSDVTNLVTKNFSPTVQKISAQYTHWNQLTHCDSHCLQQSHISAISHDKVGKLAIEAFSISSPT
jgi:hypothetical protein